jgi:endonuclease YncB( thermonuclease family)
MINMNDQLPRRIKPPLSLRRAILLAVAVVVVLYRARYAPLSLPSFGAQDQSATPTPAAPTDSCTEWQGCFTGLISHIVDGDTIDVRSNGNTRRVRLVLVDAPERDTPQGPAATAQLTSLCALNSPAAVYPDLRQPQDDYGRILGVIYCGGRNANAEMIRSGKARLYKHFCSASVFGTRDWARELGCKP